MMAEAESPPGTSATETKKPERLRQYLGAIIASLGGFALGVSLGWNSSTSEVMKNTLDASAMQIGLIGGVLNLGACVGVASLTLVLKFVSRTGAMFVALPVFLLGWTLIIFADQSVPVYITGRMLCGICGGAYCVLTPLYVGEIAEKEIRGKLLTYFQLSINLGVMFAYAMAHVMREDTTLWRYSLACALTTSVIALVNLLPESPMYHLDKDREARAIKSMEWYRGVDYNMDNEIDEIKQLVNIRQSKSVRGMERVIGRDHGLHFYVLQGSSSVFKNKEILRAFMVSFGVMIIQQLSGINTLIFYTLAIFNAGGGDMTSSEQCLIVGVTQIVACALAGILIDALGRRVLLIGSSFFMGLSLILLGWFFYVQERDPEFADMVSWMPLTWITLFFAAFNIGVGPVSWALLGEIFPVEVKLRAAVAAAFLSWLLSLVITLLFGEMLDGLGTPQSMWFFAIVCWFGAAFCAFFVKETKGKSLFEIQIEFGEADVPEPRTNAT